MKDKTIISQIYAYLNPKLEANLIFQSYDTSHQIVNEEVGKWQPDGPENFTVELSNIWGFRNVTKQDYHDHTCWDCYFPTDICIMEYYDKSDKKQKTIFIADSLKNTQKLFDTIIKKHNKVQEYYNVLKKKVENEFNEGIKEVLENIN